jgi:hypothetical protein
MKNSFKNSFKTFAVLFLTVLFLLGGIHFHANDLTLHHDCLACISIDNGAAVSLVTLVLAVIIFIAWHLFLEVGFHSTRLLCLERLRAPPH